MKFFKKIAISEIDKRTKGAIVDSENITNKEDNTYSANIIDALINGVKSLIDKVKVPTKTSELTNDSGFVTGLKISSVTTTAHYAVEQYFSPQTAIETDVAYTNAGYYPISVSANCDGVRLEQLYIVSGGLGTATIHFRMFNTSAGTAYIGKLTIFVTWAK